MPAMGSSRIPCSSSARSATPFGLPTWLIRAAAAPGIYNSFGQAYKIAKSGPYIFLANDDAGLLILSYSSFQSFLPLAVR